MDDKGWSSSPSAWAVWKSSDAQSADRYTMETLQIASAVLMERAALAVARVLDERHPGAVEVFCGPGNNGADGLAIARILHLRGRRVRAWLVTSRGNAARDQQLSWARSVGVRVFEGIPSHPFDGDCVLVDALLGTGAAGCPRGTIATALEWARQFNGTWVAVDIPTGVDPDTGKADTRAIHAQDTVTFARAKLGLLVGAGREHAGRVTIADIGIVPEPGPASLISLINPGWISRQLLSARDASHKYVRGHVGVLGGSFGMEGAAQLSGVAALRGGAGVCTIYQPSAKWDDGHAPPSFMGEANAAANRSRRFGYPELMHRGAEPWSDAFGETVRAWVVGPGLSANDASVLNLEQFYAMDRRPALWDAGALAAITPGPAPRADRVLTPHPGEAARLCEAWGISTHSDGAWTSARVDAERCTVAQLLAQRAQATVVLKGATTVIANADTMRLCVSGSSALATAGSGDVLAGLIAAWLGRGLSGLDAATMGVEIHARAGQRLGDALSGITASDISNEFGAVYRSAMETPWVPFDERSACPLGWLNG